MLDADQLAEVNRILGVQEPSDDILYEGLPTGGPTETPVEDVPVEDTPAEMPVVDAPAKPSDEATVNAQMLADAARNFQSSKWYQDTASNSTSIQIRDAFEYSLEDFGGYNVHVLMVRAEGIDIGMWGFSADTFLVDLSTGNVHYDGTLDMNNWGDFATVEDCFACILASPVWEADGIWSEDETRTDLPQSMIDTANNALS